MKRKKRIPTNTTTKTAARHTRSPSVDVKLWMIHRPDLSVALDISIQTVLDVHTKLRVSHTPKPPRQKRRKPLHLVRDSRLGTTAQTLLPSLPNGQRNFYFISIRSGAPPKSTSYFSFCQVFFFFFFLGFFSTSSIFVRVCVCVCASRNDFPSPKVQCAGGQRVLANNSIRSANNGNAKMHRGEKKK